MEPISLHRRLVRIAVGGAIFVAAPYVLSEHYVTVLISAAIYTVITVGLNIFMGYTGQISFGHNAFAAIGGYASAILATRLGMPPLIALLVAAALAALAAAVVGYPTLRLRGHYLAMATLSFGLITFEVSTQWRGLTEGPFGISAIPPLGVGSWELSSDPQFFYAYWIIAGLSVWAARRIRGARIGRAFRAIAGSEEAAGALGVNVAGFKLLAFVISAVYASVGGSMFAHYVTYISPEVFGSYMVVLLFTMIFVGGIGTAYGPLLGAVAITILPEVLRGATEIRELIYGALLLLILLFAPRGLSGLRNTRLFALLPRWI
ncbi:MAG: branched-chain amino acid ABC transporter permease [Candidatus Eiseniibacteriota bacterium]